MSASLAACINVIVDTVDSIIQHLTVPWPCKYTTVSASVERKVHTAAAYYTALQCALHVHSNSQEPPDSDPHPADYSGLSQRLISREQSDGVSCPAQVAAQII